MSTNIPKAREILEAALCECRDQLVKSMIEDALSLMTREKSKSVRAAVKSTPMSDALREEIYRFYRDNPAMSTKDIANKFNVNQGRITETIQRMTR